MKVIAFGETLLDIVHSGKSVLGTFPGGSILNSTVSLARCGIPVQLMTETSKDGPGLLIRQFLLENNIDLSYACEYSEGKTALAFALLDGEGKANYTFYKDYPKNRYTIGLPELDKDTLLLFGSLSALDGKLMHVMQPIVNRAREAGSILYYDPNLRQDSFKNYKDPMSLLKFNLFSSHIIKGSDEDFEYIYKTSDITKVWDHIQPSVCRLLIITRGANNVHVLYKGHFFTVKVPDIKVVSSVGAGDAFTAGLIAAMAKMGIRRDDLNKLSDNQMEFMLENGISFATDVCTNKGNYIGNDIAEKFRKLSTS